MPLLRPPRAAARPLRARSAAAALLLTLAGPALGGCASAEPQEGAPGPEAPREQPPATGADATATPSASSPAPTREGVIRIGVPLDRAGLSAGDPGEPPEGVDVDAAVAVAERLGFPRDRIVWRSTTSRSASEALAAGTVDLAVGPIPTDGASRGATAGSSPVVAGPTLTVGHDLLVVRDGPVTGPASLRGRTVCAVRDGAAITALAAELPEDAAVLEVDAVGECLPALLSGRADAAAGDAPELAALARDEAADGSLVLAGSDYGRSTYGVGLPAGSSLCDEATEALAELHDDAAWRRAVGDVARASGDPTTSVAVATPDPTRCG